VSFGEPEGDIVYCPSRLDKTGKGERDVTDLRPSLVWGHTDFRVNLKRGMTQRHSRTEIPSLVENNCRLHGLMTDGVDKDAKTLVDLGSLA